MNPKIETVDKKYVIGMQSSMHHGEMQQIIALWKQFMPNKYKIDNNVGQELIALQYYANFNDTRQPYDIMACTEVTDLKNIPDGLVGFTIPKGEYAVFVLKGTDAGGLYRKILSEWLPTSGCVIDDRPHFQVMGKKYINGSEKSEEDFYIPIKSKL
ncbi:GyrI-like domain-containing protein [Winogradskyella alexanderae]|uniref:Effector binding domain-containing protein n=1 Tax=Winogradskyella alexanderae TaxID=2877123 RepID=A0ABS7XVA8_9FLAO|nr:effector binding domain-containing protein [Winogradskyella alexanderae]MCA0132761.1 effector binding domain-containing protein [Winogradskyella alexanderae]